MQGDTAVIRTVLILAVCGCVQCSFEHGAGVLPIFQAPVPAVPTPLAAVPASFAPVPAPVAAIPVPQPVVTSASAQYFERTFNRLIVPQIIEPVIPVSPPRPVFHVAPPQTVIPVAQPPPVLVQPTASAIPVAPVDNGPIEPNVAIAVATAHAPVKTIFVQPYPFRPPSTIGFIPPTPPIIVPDESRKEPTTQITTKVEVKTTTQPENTTPLPLASNSDNSFVQALPSNVNTNFKVYGPPRPQWTQQQRPQKLKTSVEVVPVPLAYIKPPPLPSFEAIKTVKHIHTFVPTKAKIIIRPVHRHIVSSPIKIRTVGVPTRLVYRPKLTGRIDGPGVRLVARDIEPTTFRPFFRQMTSPPRL